MRPLSTIRAAGLLAAGAMLIAACGGNAATPAPTAAPPTTAPTEAPVPTDVPSTTEEPGFSFALPSFHGDEDLEGMLPDTVGGEALTVLSMTGDQFLTGAGSSPELNAALGALNKTPADLSVAFGGNSSITIVAFRVQGVGADVLFNAFKQSQTSAYTTDSVSYGGKSVTKITPSDDTSIAFVYIKGDTMFLIGSPDTGVPSDDLLNEAFSKLP